MPYPNELFKKIIQEQGQIIGRSLAHSRADYVGGLQFKSQTSDDVEITNEPKTTLSKLINSYAEVFGQSSVDVCIDVIKSLPYSEVMQYLPENIISQVHPNATAR
ncbi:hypothetical protein A3H26_02880 [candidate division WWE3 bacterium RIFCSPLOWO2_12_FULL_36_10]|uniref:Uncharacterized protein n=1 Tax=candidate division WWE3 bacterium RIFCSPLOWO2_12_FULL_36_10 TaxID=1802630 RepID=A0A1F4VLH0_UNCKA|nr:MAG: hypothetical protein A3H26_02880 [candidate division WWE3 bacterium RIFCSPLOWO2_12_FULL_36_10]